MREKILEGCAEHDDLILLRMPSFGDLERIVSRRVDSAHGLDGLPYRAWLSSTSNPWRHLCGEGLGSLS